MTNYALGRNVCGNFERAITHEWLVTNGIGGYASGTISDTNTRGIDEVADAVAERLTRLFRRDAEGRRPVFGAQEKFQTDPHFCDYILYHEYFHGDNGRGIGASHQTGWTGLIAKLLQPYRHD